MLLDCLRLLWCRRLPVWIGPEPRRHAVDVRHEPSPRARCFGRRQPFGVLSLKLVKPSKGGLQLARSSSRMRRTKDSELSPAHFITARYAAIELCQIAFASSPLS